MAGGLRIIRQNLETVTKWNTIWRWKWRFEWWTHKPKNVSKPWNDERKTRNRFFPECSRITFPGDNLTPEWTSRLWDEKFLLFNHSVLCHRLDRAAVVDLQTACLLPVTKATTCAILQLSNCSSTFWHIPLHPSQHQEAAWVNMFHSPHLKQLNRISW